MSDDGSFEEACQELARTLVDVMLASNDADMFTVVGVFLYDGGGTEFADGEYWPDAQHVTFTEVDPPVTFTEVDPPAPSRPARRERLQDWIDRSGDLLEDDDR